MTENQHPEVPPASATPATAAMPAAPSGAASVAAPEGAPAPADGGPRVGGAPYSEKPAGSRIKIDMPADGDPEPMRPATRMPKWPSEAESGSAAETGPTASTAAAKTEPAASSTPAAAASPSAAKAEPAATTAAAAVTAPSTQAAKPAPAAVSAPAAKPGPAAKAGPVAEAKPEVFVEQSPTTMLQVRPPQEEVDRRVAAREQAANTKPVLPRVFQVLLAVFYPVVLLVLAIRLVTTNAFLWVEYHRPGFPADSFGFSTDDRLTYGSYTVDYLLNFAGPRYLGGLVNDKGVPLFLEREVAHMADVKSLIDLAFLLGLVLAIVMVIGIIYLSRRSVGGVRRGLFAGSIATLVLIIALGVLALMGWETFFTDFHKVFFANGTWTFYTDDTLIRLFPSQFWSDGGIFIGAFVLVVSSLTLAFTWPTKDRRQAVTRAKRPGRRAAAQ